MDRKPLDPPFDGTRVPYVEPGLEVTIARTANGRRGTLQPLPGDWGDDEDGPPLDRTADGRSVYEIQDRDGKSWGRIIWAADAHEWEGI